MLDRAIKYNKQDKIQKRRYKETYTKQQQSATWSINKRKHQIHRLWTLSDEKDWTREKWSECGSGGYKSIYWRQIFTLSSNIVIRVAWRRPISTSDTSNKNIKVTLNHFDETRMRVRCADPMN